VHARTTVPGLYAAGDLACVPHNYMIGAFVFGDLAGEHATGFAAGLAPAAGPALPEDQLAAAHELIYRPLRHPDGPPQTQVEYKLRRFVNDYVAPPKTAAKLRIALETFQRMTGEIESMGARTPYELMRCAEVSFIRDCAELATRASLVRTESRWGLYHDRSDRPDRDDAAWFCHLNVRQDSADQVDGVPDRPAHRNLSHRHGHPHTASIPAVRASAGDGAAGSGPYRPRRPHAGRGSATATGTAIAYRPSWPVQADRAIDPAPVSGGELAPP
jgi:succinate dehydrogenase/fumarate reductase flavoprotein subunit